MRRVLTTSEARRRSGGLAAALALATLGAAASPATSHADSKQDCLTDGSVSFEFCAAFEYDEVRDGDQRFVKMNRMRAKVRVKDRQVSIVTVELGAFVSGRCLNGCQTLLGGQRLALVPGRRPSTNVVRSPPWSPYFVQVGGLNRQCAVVRVRWKRGSKTFKTVHDLCMGGYWDTLKNSEAGRALTVNKFKIETGT